MTIRNRLLAYLLPTVIVFILLISAFFYYTWVNEIFKSFRAHLKAVVISTAKTLNVEDIQWLITHKQDPNITESTIYKKNQETLARIKSELPLVDIYVIEVHNQSLRPESYLVNADEDERHPADYAFTSPDKQDVLASKKAIVTPIYEGQDTHHQFMTAFAPIVDSKNHVFAVVAADVNLDVIDQKRQQAIAVMALTAGTAILSIAFIIMLIAHKIATPVQKLKDAALAIAAGEYGQKVSVEGPREIAELANTLTTMSECLKENISRLRESSAARERLYGEYECSQLLQYNMFQKVVDQFQHPRLSVQCLKIAPVSPSFGFYVDIKTLANGDVRTTLRESKEKGFSGIYHLLKEGGTEKKHPELEVNIQLNKMTLKASSTGMPVPIVWSTHRQTMVPVSAETPLEERSVIFLYNSGFARYFSESDEIQEWLRRSLKHFATEGLDLFMTMLHNELSFLTQKRHIDPEICIICFQIK